MQANIWVFDENVHTPALSLQKAKRETKSKSTVLLPH